MTELNHYLVKWGGFASVGQIVEATTRELAIKQALQERNFSLKDFDDVFVVAKIVAPKEYRVDYLMNIEEVTN